MKSVPRDQPCLDCGRFDNRGMTIDALIVKDSKILLVKRGVDPCKGYWATPGGYTDWDEDLVETAKREVREELNVESKVIRLQGIYSDPARSPKQAFAAAFIVEIEGVPKAGDDAVDCKWFDLDDVPENMAFDHRQIVEDFKNGASGVF